jgi:hypothetical protein
MLTSILGNKGGKSAFAHRIVFLIKKQISFKSLDWIKGKSTGNHGFYHKI